MNLKNKVALITGAARGIGKSTVIDLARQGYDVVINYNTSKEEALALKNKIDNEFKVKALAIKADITNEKEVEKMFKEIIKHFDKIDILINNAALSIDGPLFEKTKQEFMKVLETNVYGTFLVSKYAAMYMEKGVIINISSTDAIDTYNELNIDYSASKAAINSLTKTFSLIFPKLKILSLMPLWVNTEAIKEMDQEYLKNELKRTDQNRLLDPSEVSSKIIELINSDLASGSIIRMEE